METSIDKDGRTSIVPNLKTLLDKGECIYYHNGEDMAVAFKSRQTGHYCYMFNTKALFGYLTYKTFLIKLVAYNSKRKMVIDHDENN